jgi:predicted phosphodiesterase
VQILILNDIHAAEYTAYKTFLDSQAPDFLAVNGDLSGTGCYSLDQCKTLFEGLSYPYLFTPGNHDLENSCDGHIYDVTGNNVDVFQEKSLVTVRMDMCAIGSSGEGTFTTEDEAFLKAALDQYAGKGMNFVVLTHCHTKLTWRKYHWPVANAERMNSMLESYAPEYNKVIVIAAHEHVTYNEVTNGVLYATVGAFGLCPYEYGVLTISGTEAKFESKAWKSDSRCKYPLRHSDSAVYHTKTI